MELRLRSGTLEVLHFDPETSFAKYKGNALLLEYKVGQVKLSTYLDDGYSAIKVKEHSIKFWSFELKSHQGFSSDNPTCV